ncbi:MASE1 domain-containing protein [Methylogaea oryzae]|uniref:MASE1 domain-containing protein n=1 Tax=Methylogaea oryzae TaxID=1295382 RepID=UPI0006D23F08|nr:MASE1 domain-containing protein [Methylogaea oryzae]
MSQLPTPHRYRPAAFFALLIAYLATGKLCLLLALPPVYSTPLFPPAGLALAAVYLAGKRALPWIFVGAWLLNLWTGYTPASSVRAAAFAAAMGLAPVVQAWSADGFCIACWEPVAVSIKPATCSGCSSRPRCCA